MPTIDDSVAAATAVVGYNLFGGKSYAQKPYVRHLKRIGFVGGNAINEATVELMVGGVSSGGFRNNVSGVAAVRQSDDMKNVDIGVLPNEIIEAFVRVAPTTSPLVWSLDIDEAPH